MIMEWVKMTAVNMSELQYPANLEMVLQFWYFLGTRKKETAKFACNKLVKGLCEFYYCGFLLVFAESNIYYTYLVQSPQ